MRKLRLLDGKKQHGPCPEVERDRTLGLELAIPLDRLAEELADPAGRLAEEKAAVSPRGTGADSAPVDHEDALPGGREGTCRRAAGDAGSDDDGVGAA